LGGLFRKHLAQHHGAEPQTAIDPQVMQGSVPQMIGVIGVTSQAAVMFSYLTSENEAFNQKTQAMRKIVMRAIEQKKVAPLVTP